MKEIGELLREAREEKGVSLQDISRETKISVQLLKALEEGEFSRFPGKVYLKGALRYYAEAIGIDSRELFSFYDRILEGGSHLSKGKSKEIKEDVAERKGPFVRKPRKPFPIVVLLWIAVLSVVVGGSLWYRYQQRLNGGETITYPGEFLPNGDLEPEPEPVDEEEKEAEPEPEPQAPSLVLLQGDGRGGIYVISGVENMEIELSFKGDCWVSVQQDGRLVEEKIYRKDERRRLNGGRETTVRFGNPPMAQISVNGNAISLAGIGNPYNLTIRKE